MKAFDDNFAFDENGILNAANHILVGSGNNTITTNDLRNATAVYGNISPNNNGEEGGTFYNIMREGLPVSQLAEFNRDLVDNIHLQFTSEKGYDEPNGWTSLLMPQNSRRVNVIDLNKNFWIIGQVISGIIGEIMMDPSDPNLPSIKKNYLNMFQAFLNEYMQLWENVLYLWLLMMTQEKGATEKPIVKYVYLNESSLLMERKFDITQKNNNPNITLEAVYDAIKGLAYEYPHSHLCVIPIIRCNNYYKNYYEEEAYPGIFYHAPCLNRKIFKISKKFIFIPFSPYEEGDSRNVNFNPFTAHDFFRTGQISLYWACGYRIFKNHLYYMCPYSSIEQTKEIVPKRYYTAISSHFNSGLSVVNGKLHFDEFIISYKDEVASAIDEREVTLASAAASGSAPIDIGTLGEEMYVDGQLRTDIIVRQPICFSVTIEQKSRRNLTKISNFRNRAGFKFNLYAGECISRFAESIEEDYSYLIEYVPFAHEQTVGENELIRDSSFSDLNSHVSGALKTKDNDLLEKHYAWDNERNNIIEDKFVLRIGQHIEADAVPAHNDLIPEEFRFNDKIQYFDYKSLLNHDIEEKETQSNVEFYNSGTIEVGAYLNIPFIKKESKRVTYYPDFLSHTYGSNNLIPLTSIEYKIDSDKPEYFSYDKVFRDYSVEKDVYFQLYTSNGTEDFEDDNWCIKMIEVISQDTPIKESFFEEADMPPYEVATMDELYNYYINNKNKIKDESILPYFSQLNPCKENNTGGAAFRKQHMLNSVSSNYSQLFPAVFGNKAEQMYEAIADVLVNDIDITTSSGVHASRSSYEKQVGSYHVYMPEYVDQATGQTVPERSYDEPITISLSIFGNSETLTALKNIDNNWSSIESKGNYQFFYKNYDEYNSDGTIKEKHTYPRSQLDISTNNNNKIYDETYQSYFTDTAITKLNFLYNNFASPMRFQGTKFQIFGANIPVHDYADGYSPPRPLSPPSGGSSSNSYYDQFDWYNIIGVFPQDMPQTGGKYYSYLNPGNTFVNFSPEINFSHQVFIDGREAIINNGNLTISTSIGPYTFGQRPTYYGTSTLTVPDILTPTINIMGYSTWYSGGEEIVIEQYRQYPHVFLLSEKTLLPNKYFRKQKANKINYSCFKNNNNIKKLSSYYSKISLLDEVQKIPYPFPNQKKSISQNINISNDDIMIQGIDNLKNQINYTYPKNMYDGDAYVYGQYSDAPDWARSKFAQNNHRYRGLTSEQITPYNDWEHYSTKASPYIVGYIEFMRQAVDEIFGTKSDYGLKGRGNHGYGIPDYGTVVDGGTGNRHYATRKINIQSSWIGKDQQNYVYEGSTNLNPNIELNYFNDNALTSLMNLQIIIHYFGSNGTYARKIMTRQLDNTIVNSDNHFKWDGTTDLLTYKSWTNDWKISYSNQTIYNNFKNSLIHKGLFKQSPQIIDESGAVLDFESYPNTGLSSEGSHTES